MVRETMKVELRIEEANHGVEFLSGGGRESKERATEENKVGEKGRERKAGKMRLGIA